MLVKKAVKVIVLTLRNMSFIKLARCRFEFIVNSILNLLKGFAFLPSNLGLFQVLTVLGKKMFVSFICRKES